MQEEILVHVRGIAPIPWGGGEEAWRRKLAHEARLVREKNIIQGISASTHFSVDIVFFMAQSHVERADLDNLAKPILDTLFRSRNPQVKDLCLTGALFNVDDDRVFKLTLEKRLVPVSTEEGVEISITMHEKRTVIPEL